MCFLLDQSLTLSTAEAVVDAIEKSPRPLLISCGSSGRASAAALVYEAVKLGTPADEVSNHNL